MGRLWCTLYWFFVCYLHLSQLADLSVCEGTDTMKTRVSDQSGAMLYFPLDKSAEVFTSHPRTTVTGRQEGSGPTNYNDRQLMLTIMPPLPVLTRAHPFSFHWEWRQGEREREIDGGRESGEVGKEREADWHPVRKKRLIFWAPDSLPLQW